MEPEKRKNFVGGARMSKKTGKRCPIRNRSLCGIFYGSTGLRERKKEVRRKKRGDSSGTEEKQIGPSRRKKKGSRLLPCE